MLIILQGHKSGKKLVIAFPGGRGTRNMVNAAEAEGVEVISITKESIVTQ